MPGGMILKVCGMRDAQNIREVEAVVRPQMMGFICWEQSRRYVSSVPAYLPTRCIRTGVFVNPSMSHLRQKINSLRLQRIQLHGDESPEYCQRIIQQTGLPITKSLSIRQVEDIEQYRQYEGICDLLLFDTKCKTRGGSGEQFDWDILTHYKGSVPFLLAGGIGPRDAERLREFRHPMFLGIDVNSRFELSPGVKDVLLLREFSASLQSP
ncbi:MAG: phosphoribosylanthranilate isomerase [Bacteroidaceae bacterium]|nr:phosphoribosylanthranilate isomerase [Bacteroidaceae bacterium]